VGFFVHPEFWRQGVAGRLLHEALALGHSHGLRKFKALTRIENIASHRTLANAGFRPSMLPIQSTATQSAESLLQFTRDY
jgi:RimJ/RimL family protein N-acetyltransferase